MIHVNGAGFCDKQVPVLSTIGRGPVGPQGEAGNIEWPTFADPIEWDINTDYPQYTVVTHNGDSYVSRQDVSADIDISDGDYWVHTADFNGQLETFRRDIIEMQNKSYVGFYGVTEDTSDIDWSSVLQEISAVSDTVYFGSGSWDVGSGLVIPNGIKKIVGSGATLYTSEASAPYLIQTNATIIGLSMSGMNLDGRGKVDKLLESNSNNWQQIIGCNFYNIGTGHYGIWNNYIGLVVVGCSFNVLANDDERYVTAGGICIKTHTDNQIVGCKFFKYDIAISALGANIGNCYFWASRPYDGIVITPEGYTTEGVFAANTFDICMTNCEFDCIRALCINPRNFIVTNSHFYWNDRDIDDTLGLFLYNGTQTILTNITVSDNIIKTQDISYDVYMFGSLDSMADPTAKRIRHYVSENNHITGAVYNTRAINRYHLLMGFINNDYVRSSSYMNVLTPQEMLDDVDVSKADYRMSGLDLYKYIRIDSVRDMLIDGVAARRGIKDFVTVFYDEQGRDLIPISPMAINSIKVNNATPFWFTLYDGRESGANASLYPNVSTSYYANYTACNSQ